MSKRLGPYDSRDERKKSRASDGAQENVQCQGSEQCFRGVGRHDANGQNECKQNAPNTFEYRDGPTRKIKDRREQIGQIVDFDHPKRR